MNGVSLTVAPRSLHGLMGPNGAGKTTLFNIVSGFIPPDSGRVLISGISLDKVPIERRIGLGMSRTFQHAAVFRRLSCLDNVVIGREPGSSVVVDDPGVSRTHLVAHFDDDRWVLEDRSRGGSYEHNYRIATVELRRAVSLQLGRDHLLRDGLRMLGWLLAGETRNGHLSVVPAGGWGRGENRPAFDQYPIEVAALADACARAAAVTGDTAWLTGVEMSVAWLLGDNDARIPMLDERTGGCSDALSRISRSRNQGAESTLAMISVLQQGARRFLPAQHGVK